MHLRLACKIVLIWFLKENNSTFQKLVNVRLSKNIMLKVLQSRPTRQCQILVHSGLACEKNVMSMFLEAD